MTRSVFHMKGQIGAVAQRRLSCDLNETGEKRALKAAGTFNTEAYPPIKTAFM